MIYPATKAIADHFTSKDIKFRINETEKSSTLETGFSGKNLSSMRVKFISHDDDNDVAVRVFGITKVPENKQATILPTINRLNNDWRYAKFVLDEDGDINLEYDLPMNTTDVAETALEVLVRSIKMADDAYPEFMKALWG